MTEKRYAWAEKRGTRYLGRYRNEDGKTKSAGMHDTKEAAVLAAQRRAALGTAGDYLDMTLEEYVLHWRDSHLGEEKIAPAQKWGHYRTLAKFVLPSYGRKKIADFETNQWLAHEIVGSVLSHPRAQKTSQKRVRMAMGSAFRPLVKRGLLRMNPMAGVEVQRPARAKQPIFKPQEFAAIVEALELPAQKACAQFMLYSAMRPGEVFALRVCDIQFRPTGMAFIQQQRRIVMPIDPEAPEAIEETGSKAGDGHQVKLSPKQAKVLRDHIEREGLSGDDLVFPRRLVGPLKGRRTVELEGEPEGTYDDGKGHTAAHGTTTAYFYGCRCQWCRYATTVYRREKRRRDAKPKASRRDCADDYMTSRRWYPIFQEAVARSGVKWTGKAYTVRAAAATWMFKAGADLPDVQEALNHKNAATTLLYLRAAKEEEERTVNSALDDLF